LLTDIFADVAHGQKMYPKYRMTHTRILSTQQPMV